MPLLKKYKCAFCDREFTREVWYRRHSCEKKKRFEQANSIHVQQAHRLFTHWQKRSGLMRRGRSKTMEEFVKSPFFNTFLKLVKYASENYLISAFTYMDWLVEEGVPDYQWTNRDMVEKFKADYRRFEVPMEQVKHTVDNIRAWCASQGWAIKEFFAEVRAVDLLTMVIEGRMSPWVLFSYAPALEAIRRLDDETFLRLNEFINVEHWMDEVEKNQAQADDIVTFMKESLGV